MTVTDMCLEQHLYVIPDMHHTWKVIPDMKSDAIGSISRMKVLMKQITHCFAPRDEKLIFEVLNKPEGSSKTVNHINQLILQTIRKTGSISNHEYFPILPNIPSAK